MAELSHRTTEVLLSSTAGELEALLELPVQEPEHTAAAVICHPHPLYGGSMHSKVVFTASQAFLDLGIPTLRFNFRGVGRSSGRYDKGIGELDDVRAAINYMAEKYKRIIIAGHSFGAWAGMRAGCEDLRVGMLIGIGMPADFADMSFLMDCQKPRLFIHGTLDTLIPIEKIERLYASLPEPKKFTRIEGADHFFTGKFGTLSEAVRHLVKEYLPLSGL
ncbi:putative hydrolase of the alpha/beta superfamily [Candidatus Methanoperedens nitroreducens]|uniref:Putative hydrolase of the alpha/beta superfamily n=1 Tax=Candidatus Methanoperedens nitratireducens TaxID=1392998 RepID=A0A062V5E7_9EURY|nr:alpha/beta fold hydrolase [Candidatus Methanoperedens nitroreducens]KCZ70630.1 putative hydrolase of the alpha/beta superfamily [Candidatus Methanoperedens nitroreducens]MDJ1420486.1 alpha/beta fold hydrolase [Candidatus Methanoperedens sp.]